MFRFIPADSPLKFTSSDYQHLDLCEDILPKSVIFSIVAFDETFSQNPVCYSIDENEYFGLVHGNNSPNGDVMLLKSIDYEVMSSDKLEFFTRAYFCNRPSFFVTQRVAVTILNVNEEPPIPIAENNDKVIF